MKIIDHISKANSKTQFTFEVIPPLKGNNISSLINSIDLLMEFH